MTHISLPDERYLAAAQAALTRPADFGYRGDKDLFRTWGITPFMRHRDSDRADRSNYRTIFAALRQCATQDAVDGSLDPSDLVDDQRSNCWAHGWREEIVCRVLIDASVGITITNLTRVFMTVVDYAHRLAEHPIFDEDDLAALEDQEIREAFDTAWNALCWSEVSPNFGDDEMKEAVYEALTASGLPDGFGDEALTAAVVDWTWQLAWSDYARTYAAQLALFDATLTHDTRA